MNTSLLTSVKELFQLRLVPIFALLLVFGKIHSQDIAISAASGGLAASPLNGGITNVSVFGVQLSKAGGGGRTVTGLTFAMTTDPNGKFLNPRLYESTDATFSGVGTETLIAGGVIGTLNATDISFSGGTITDFDGASGVDTEFIFLVVDVVPGVTVATPAIVPSLATTGVTTLATVTGSTITGTSYTFVAPVTTIANLSTGLAAAPLVAGSTGKGVFGFSLTSTGGQTVTVINVQVTNGSPATKWVTASYALITSTDADFSTTGDNSAPIGGLTFTPTATQIGITGLSQSITTTAKNYFLVTNIDPAVTVGTTNIQPSLVAANVTATTGTLAGTATGTDYNFAAAVTTIANLSTGLAVPPLLAGSTGQGVFGFSLTSTGGQTVSVINIQVSTTAVSKWGAYSLITSTDNSFATTGDNSAPIGGLSFDASSGTQIAITGLAESITTTTKNYFLVVNVNTAVNGTTAAIVPSLGLANVTVANGTVAGSAAPGTSFNFAPLLTIATLSTGVAANPLIASATNQGVFGFSLTSSGSQTVTVMNVQVTNGSPATKWVTASYALITSTDPSYATTGDNSAPIGGLTFTPSASQIAITGLSQVITSGTNYFLVVNIDPGVTGATTSIQASLGAANITITTGGGAATGTATGTDYSFSQPTATFTEITAGTAPVIAGTLLSAGSTLQVLTGFSATSNSTQQITSINFNYTPANPTAQFSTERLYRSTVIGSVGVEVANDGSADGTFGGLTENINATPVYFYLVVDVANTVTSATPSVTTAPTEANITVAGNKNPMSISRTFTFGTSQLSDIVLGGSVTTLIPYRTRQAATIDNSNLSLSTRLASYQVRDGAGSDPDDKGTNLTSLTISVTNSQFIRAISLFDDDTDTEIAGTEQAINGTVVGTITFTPVAPISTTDNGVRNLMVRATFWDLNIVDNAQIQLAVSSVAANTSGSGFSPVGGWASTTTAITDNLMDVIATKLVFSPTLPTSVTVNTNFSATVRAFDGLNNQDVDRTDQFALTESGPGTLTSFGGTTLTPLLVAGQFTWTDLRLSLSGSYPFLASDDAYVDFLGGDAAGNITISSPACAITPGTTTPATICYGNTVAGALPTAYFPLGNITILETDPAGISGSPGAYTFSILLPSGFVFDQTVISGVSSPLNAGTDITIPAAPHYSYPSSNTVQFSFTLNAIATLNNLIISGLRVGYTHPGTASPPATGVLNITRSGGSANIAGVTPGTVLGTVGASQQNPAVTITVAPAIVTDPPIDPNTTTFNVSGIPVKLVSSTPAGSVFTGTGVTFPNPDYRFNPNTLTAGNYPVVLTQTAGSGCQSFNTKVFEVIVSGIIGLNSIYCDNDLPSTGLTVNQVYIDQIMQFNPYPTTWVLDQFVYYKSAFPSAWLPITSPSNNAFAPGLPTYDAEYLYWGGQIPIGFSVYNTNPAAGVPAGSNFVATYQWVTVRVAPTVNFTVAPNHCEDNAPVTLIGSPPNSTNITNDNFTQAVGQGASINHSTVGPDEVWTFSPNAVTGVSSSTSVSFDITYKYTDPATNCSNTAVSNVTVHDRPLGVPAGNITKSIPGPPSNTTIQLCAGTTVGSFTATDNTYTYRWYSDPLPVSPINLKGVGITFNPPVDNLVAMTTPFYVTRERNGCESVNTPLALSVNVIAAPPAPTPNFGDLTRQYCVGGAINPTHLGVPGTNLKWYNGLPPLTPPAISPIADDNQPTIAELSVNTSAANVFRFSVTQTELVNGCEGPSTPVTVTVQALPVISIAPIASPIEICTTADVNLKLTPTDQGNPAPGLNWTVDPGPPGTPGVLTNFNGIDGTVELNPLTGTPGTYTLRYTYINGAGCANSGTRNVRIFPTVTPNISIGTVCDGFPAIITNTSAINPTTSTISSATWTFGDGQVVSYGTAGSYTTAIDPTLHPGITSGTYQNPRHIYPNVGTFQIEGQLTTSDGCTYDIPQQPVTISDLPIGDFSWEKICLDSTSNLSSTEFVAFETSVPPIPLASYEWNFNVNNTLTYTVGNTAIVNPTVNYDVAGTDEVQLIITTSALCRDTIRKPVFIVPTYSAIKLLNAYAQDFEIDADGWIDGGMNSSWSLGLVAGDTIQSNASTGAASWFTDQAGPPPIANQSAWVMSGCFDFSGAVKPVIAFDIWSDTPDGIDGAVLQYNTSGNIEDDDEWEVIGTQTAGINWYDDTGIANSPGNQSSTDLGWTGTYAGWKRAIYSLDTYVAGETSPVVFRIAFASAQGRQDGFAFDNAFIGERTRVVLVENFTNSTIFDPVPPPNKGHNEAYNEFGNSAEVVRIQYHTAFPDTDPLNAMNVQMNNSRTAFYGITNAPTFRIDGQVANSNAAASSIYDNRVLTPATVGLRTTATKVGSHVEIRTTVKNNSSQTIQTTGAHVFTAIVEKTIDDPTFLGASGNTEFKYVAKDLLPSPSGLEIQQDILPGDSIIMPVVIWEDLTLINPDSGAIVVFLQNIGVNNKSVAQANIIDVDPATQIPDVITGIEDPAYAEKINFFPNPANHELNIELPAAVRQPTAVTLTDAFGRTVYHDTFGTGEFNKTVNTTGLAGGIYIVQIRTPEGGNARRKVMVVHR